MRILQLCTDLRLGGMQRFVVDLSQELAKQGHEVVLATHWTDAIDAVFPQNGEVPLYSRVSFGKENGGFSLGLMWRINSYIRSFKPDIVHTHLFSLLYASPSMILHLPRKTRFIHTVHSQAAQECSVPYRYGKFLYKHCTAPIAISGKVQKTMDEFYGGLKAPLILNGCCPDSKSQEPELSEKIKEIRQKHNGRIFLQVGHISKNKNQLMLNRVSKRLNEEGYHFGVVIVGREDDKEYAQQFYQEKAENVYYLGPCNHCQALTREADFFTLCSSYEGMPISLLEALANGCVPVCTPAGGIPDGCINHQNGLLASENTEQGLYDVMKEALDMSDECYTKYKAASLKLFAERFSMEKCASEYNKLYEQAVNGAVRP